jgi:hypothetical protein
MPLRADHAGHPLGQAVAQQPEMVAVHLGRGGLFQLVRVDGGNHRFAVVFVQARPGQRLGLQAQALGDAGKRLGVAAQRAGDHRVERKPLALKYSPRRTLCWWPSALSRS